MATIFLNDILKQNSDLTIAGTMFYDIIKKEISNGQTVVVDMESVTSLPSIFLNVSFGKIIDEFGLNTIRQHISFIKITKIQAERLQKYLGAYSA